MYYMNSKQYQDRIDFLIEYFLEHGHLPSSSIYRKILEEIGIDITDRTVRRDIKHLKEIGFD